MLSYQHGFHAGNRADVLKHACLHAILTDLRKDPGPILYVETHAGRGQYDLTGPQANKTGEAEAGVLKLLQGKAPKSLSPWLDFVRQTGLKAYPGSPKLAASLLASEDRLVLFERHPQEYQALAANMAQDTRCLTKAEDGYRGALKLAPRRGERIVLMLDPSYETIKDLEHLINWVPRALRRWPRAIILIWLPLFRDGREVEFGAYLSELTEGVIIGARWPVPDDQDTALEGSAIIGLGVDEQTGKTLVRIASNLENYWQTDL